MCNRDVLYGGNSAGCGCVQRDAEIVVRRGDHLTFGDMTTGPNDSNGWWAGVLLQGQHETLWQRRRNNPATRALLGSRFGPQPGQSLPETHDSIGQGRTVPGARDLQRLGPVLRLCLSC